MTGTIKRTAAYPCNGVKPSRELDGTMIPCRHHSPWTADRCPNRRPLSKAERQPELPLAMPYQAPTPLAALIEAMPQTPPESAALDASDIAQLLGTVYRLAQKTGHREVWALVARVAEEKATAP